MNPFSPKTLDEVIAVYLEQLDDGQNPDPNRFVQCWPEHRLGFERFVAQHQRVGDWIETGSKHTSDAGDERKIDSKNPDVPAETAPLEPAPAEFAGYRLERMIGRGGMSRVYQAHRIADGSAAAIKVLDSGTDVEQTHSPNIALRFRREAEAIRSLSHDSIVPLLEYGTDHGTPFLALKLIQGCTLAQLIAALRNTVRADVTNADDHPSVATRESHRSQASTVAQSREELSRSDASESRRVALECFRESQVHHDRCKDIAQIIAVAADALQAAHDQGIVHRDIKPSNLMLDRSGHVWLTDFGLASLGDAYTLVTETGQVLGTPHYMSPEQASGDLQSIDHRSDIYSLGATLYELVTLSRPHQGDRFRVLLEISAGRLTPPSKVCSGIPRPLEAIILKAMSFAVSDRYASASEFAEDLRRFETDQLIRTRHPSHADRLVRWVLRNPRRSIAAVVGLCVAIAMVMLIQFVGNRRLSALNTRLANTTLTLEQTNDQLVGANQSLDQSRERLRRHLYVADVSAAYRAYAQQDVDAVKQLLARHIPDRGIDESDGPDLRGFEWWLLENLCQSTEKVTSERHRAAATELATLPESEQVLSVGKDGWVRHWDLNSLRLINAFEIGGSLDAIAVSPDGMQCVTGMNIPIGLNPVAIRNVTDGTLVQELRGHEYSVESAAFSPDGNWIATAGRYNEVLLHEATGQLRARVLTRSRNESLAFSPDGRRLVAILRREDFSRRQVLATWSVPDLDQVETWEFDFNPNVFAFSGDGTKLVSADARNLCLSQWSDQHTISSLIGFRGPIRCVALDSDGDQVAAGCDNGLVYLWRMTEQPNSGSNLWPPPRVIVAGEKGVTSLAFLDDNQLVATSETGAVQAWLVGRRSHPQAKLGGPIETLVGARLDDSELFLRRENGEIQRFDLTTNQFQSVAQVAPDEFFQLDVTSDHQTMVADSADELVVLSASDGNQLERIECNLAGKRCGGLRFFSGDRFLLVLYNDRLRRYQTSDWTLCDEVAIDGEGAELMVVSPDESALLVVTRSSLVELDPETLSPLARHAGGLGEFTRAEFSVDGKTLAVGHQDGTVELFYWPALERIHVMRGHRDSISDCTFTADGRTLITAARNHEIRFWDVQSGREIGVLSDQEMSTEHLHYSAPLQRLYAFGPGHPVTVWNAGRQDVP